MAERVSKALLMEEALAVACGDTDIRYVRALIVGPMGTPYQFGFYEV